MLSLLLLLVAPSGVRCQVNICYDFEDAAPNSRPTGWGALPNLDFHYVGISSAIAHTGGKSLGNNGTTCYTIMPDEGLNYGADSIWLSFYYYLHNNTDYFDVGYLTDATDSTSFHRLATVHNWSQQWYNYAVDLSSVPTGARIAFFGHDIFAADGTFWLDDVLLTSEPCAVNNSSLRVTGNWADSVRLEWDVAGDPTVTIGSGSNTYTPTGNSITVPRYFPETSYASSYGILPFNASCYSYSVQYPSPCRSQGLDSYFKVPPYREGSCVAVTDSYSSMALPYVGTPVEPYMELGPRSTTNTGITGVFAGSHSINTTPGSDDGGMMVFPRTIPPGDNVTMRLGNRLGDWESASMLYTITVDTNAADLMVMKYTVAMACGSMQTTPIAAHNDTLHPTWFSIELLDDTLGQLQPEACNRFYIDMWDTEGWDNMNSMYKRRDFTGMAFDLAPYHGQKIHLRVTATDGAVNNRWCYGYYNLECLRSNDAVGSCDSDSMILTAPYGFRYRWWKEGETATLDTLQSITVAADGSLYNCDLIDRFNPACSRTISRRVLQGPYAEVRDTVVQNQLPHSWGSQTFYGATDTTFTVPATVGCDTTVHYMLHVWPNQHKREVMTVCAGGWPVTWHGHTFNAPDSVDMVYTDIHGADSVVTLVAVEVPTYEVTDTVIVCPWKPFEYEGVDYGGPTTVDVVLASVDGCDSTVHVTLAPRDSTFAPHAYHSVDGQIWADTVPIVLCSNQRLQVVDSTEGATGWLWTLGGDSSDARMASFAFTLSDSVEVTALTLVVTSGDGCLDTVVWPVVVFPAPEADFAWWPEHPVDVEPQMQLVNRTVPDSCSWLWVIGEDSVAGYEPYYRWPGYTSPGDVAVALMASLTMQHDSITHTCTDTATQQVGIVTCWLEFPSLVTPNGDGVNDTWEVVNLVEMGLYPMNEVWIYNEWGVRVFHAKNITSHDQFWNPNTLPCSDGTYYFRFMARNDYGVVRRNGVIEVLR